MNLTSTERELLASLADLLIPAGAGFPSASQAGVAQEGVNQVLAVRPDLADPLRRVLANGNGRPASELLEEIQRSDPASFHVLAELVPGAYFLNPEVRAKLNYNGQSGRPIEAREDYLDDGLLQSVIDRGPIYRATP